MHRHPRNERFLAIPCFGGLLILASSAAAQTPIPPQLLHSVRPWVYNTDDKLVWERHEFHEDTANTVFALAHDFYTVAGQTSALPDVLLLNGPHYDPPEGNVAAAGSRNLLLDPGQVHALQLYVNYSDSPIGTNPTPKFFSPTFFISTGTPNGQTTPPLIDVGFESVYIAPTRAALGNVGGALQPAEPVPIGQEGVVQYPGPINALYITAGISVAMAELDTASQADAATASVDKLFVKQPDQTWLDRSSLVPSSAKDGNSSGVCFADFNGDGFKDLFVGKYGDDFTGDQSVILIYRPAGGGLPEAFLDETASRMPVYPNSATVDVAASDLDGDGDQDIVVANRARRGGAIGNESLDYAFVNNGSGVFTRLDLAPGVLSDSRSVAVGDLDYVVGPEIVLGNAGADGFSNVLAIPAGNDHPLQIFRDVDPSATLAFQDKLTDFIPTNESEVSRPFTWQVIVQDVFGPGTFMPDGAADLIVVNHRDILLDATASGSGKRPAGMVKFLVNPVSTSRVLIEHPRVNVSWATTAAIADFTYNHAGFHGECSSGSLDLFVGTGNSFSGCDAAYFENLGANATGWPPWNTHVNLQNQMSYEALPGNEKGYGFDFADIDDNGWIDAVQTSRGYNFLVTNMMVNTGHGDLNRHWNLTASSSVVDFSNRRGQLFPWGSEDGVFADFDGDTKLDLLLATQRGTSATYSAPQPETGETAVLRGVGAVGFHHDTTSVPAFDVPAGANPNITRDLYLDINQRNAYYRPTIGDRAHAADLNNDGKIDGLIHLFDIANPSGGQPTIPQLGTSGLTSPVDRYSAGWRVLINVASGPAAPPPWFEDEADVRLHDQTYPGPFSTEWNRGLGVDVLGDFDNNGACDFFTAVGPQAVGADVTTLHQGDDLLFMNGRAGAPVGHFVEQSATLGVPRRHVPVGGPFTATAGCAGLAQGDVDNDGKADLFVSCGARDFFSELLMNQLTAAGGQFVNEFSSRVPTLTAQLSTLIHSSPYVGNPLQTHDDVGAPILVDLDADGDLDLIHSVATNIPRFYRNVGTDSNQDGFITSADSPAPGTFADWTSQWVDRIRPAIDSVDAQAVDIDRDGDFDLAFDTFLDEVVLWNNQVSEQGARPAITEAWPRVGAKRGTRVYLEGIHLTGARAVELKSRWGGTNHIITAANITAESNGRISFVIPSGTTPGLVQVRVRRSSPPTTADEWSRQYFGYFVFGP